MKAHTSELPTRKGFTLVELLVVVAIIAILATMAVAGASMAKNAANKTKAKAAISELTTAISSFSDEQNTLPLAEGEGETAEKRTDNELMDVLCGINEDENPNKIAYFSYRKAKGKNNNYWDGLYRTQSTAEFFGPWKNRDKNERYYRIIFNYGYEDFIREPSTIGSEEIFDVPFLIYHAGKDGEIGGDSNVDNIYGWKGN
ncbi:MAG: type II secretion system protein [Akkermansiaceae bacterium]